MIPVLSVQAGESADASGCDELMIRAPAARLPGVLCPGRPREAAPAHVWTLAARSGLSDRAASRAGTAVSATATRYAPAFARKA